MNTAEQIYEEIKSLPQQDLPQIFDFIQYVKKAEYKLDDLMFAQQSSLTDIWCNDADDVWNNVPTR